MLDIVGIYNQFLEEIEQQRKEEYKSKNQEKFFRASMAGSCFKKHLFYLNDADSKEIDPKSRRLLRLGTVIHKDFEDALVTHSLSNNIPILTEAEVQIPKLKVKGTLDAAYYNEDIKTVEVFDFKSAKSWTWSKKFGYKKNRDKNPSENYELQLGTYALAIKEKLDENLSDWEFALYLVYYKKDDSSIKPLKINSEYMYKAELYWEELLDSTDNGELSPDDLIAGSAPKTPVYEWECKYCQFSPICDTPYR